MRATKIPTLLALMAGAIAGLAVIPAAQAQEGKQPNIVVIMGDDIGMWNVSAYHRGMMGGSTPTLIALPMKV